MIRAKGTARSILVSDAATVADLKPGHYRGARTHRGQVRLSGSDYLVGAALTIPEAVHKAARFARLEPELAVDMASQQPKTLRKRLTGIEPDVFSPESFTILRRNEGRLEVVTTVVAGQVRHPLSAQDALRS